MNHRGLMCYSELIGNTPLIDLSYLDISNATTIYAKCEQFNPGLSLKDRMARHILNELEKRKEIKIGGTIVCASSGNTGCSVSMLCAFKGYNSIVVTNKKCSLEKRAHIRSLGAELIVVTDSENYREVAKEIANNNGYIDLDQYNNPHNAEAYYNSLGPEIWEDTNGEITHFVMTGSTYGCISGVSKYLKEKNKNIKVILVDPPGSNIFYYFYKKEIPIYTGKKVSIIEGVGKEKPTKCLDFSVIDEVLRVDEESAVSMCRRIAKEKGMLIGGSSGLNLSGAIRVASGIKTKGSLIVTLVCDSGVKYLSKLFVREDGVNNPGKMS